MNMNTTVRLLVALGIINLSHAQDIPDYGFPGNETLAKSMAVSALLDKKHRTLHQVCAVYAKKTGLVTVEEYWIDLPTNDYKVVYRSAKSDLTAKDPLSNLGSVLELTPHHGFWKTSFGAMKLEPEGGEWVPITMRRESPLRNVFKRIKKEWFLWPGSPGNVACCGSQTVAGEDRMAALLKQYDGIVQRAQQGVGTISVREDAGLITEIRIRETSEGGELVQHVTNEYLDDSPVALDPKSGEALRKLSNHAALPFAPHLPFPKGPDSYGVLFGSGRDGAYVRAVHEKSVAAKIGVVPGDRIFTVNGTALTEKGSEASEIIRSSRSITIIAKHLDGTTYSATISRGEWGDGSWRE